MLKMLLLVPIRFSFFRVDYRLLRVLSFDLTNVIFAVCFTRRGHDAHFDLLWVLFLVGRISPLMQT